MNEVEIPLEDVNDINIDKFWELADDLLYTKIFYDNDTNLYFTKHYSKTDDKNEEIQGALKFCSEDEINTLLVSFIALVAKYCDELSEKIGEEKFYFMAAEYIMEFKYYKEHLNFCVRKMLSLLMYSVDCNLNNLQLNVEELDEDIKEEVNKSIETNEKFIKIIGWIFHEHYRHYKEELLEVLRNYRGFTALCKIIKNFIEISKTNKEGNGIEIFGINYINFMNLFFDLCKSYDFSEELETIGKDDLIYLIEQLKVEIRNENEINYLLFRSLLVLNEQYMYKCGLNIYIGDSINLVFDSILNNNKYLSIINEILILNFNREMNLIDQILMMKFLYVIFSNEITNRLMYINDIKIIIDIIIRQLYDLQLKQSEYLVNIYIRVLNCLLIETDLLFKPYKREDIKKVLEYLINSDESNDKTKRLANKCLNTSFFNNTDINNLKDIMNKNTEKSSSCPELNNLSLDNNNNTNNNNLTNPANMAIKVIKAPVRTIMHTLHLDAKRLPLIHHHNYNYNHNNNNNNNNNHNHNHNLNLRLTSLTPPPPPPPRPPPPPSRITVRSLKSSQSIHQKSHPPPPPPPKIQDTLPRTSSFDHQEKYILSSNDDLLRMPSEHSGSSKSLGRLSTALPPPPPPPPPRQRK